MRHGDRRPRRRLAVACAIFGAIAMAGDCASPGSDLAPRIVVKFVDGLAVSAEGKTVRLEPARSNALASIGITDATLSAERAEIARILAQPDVSHVAPLFSDDARGLQTGDKAGSGSDLRTYVSVVMRREASDSAVDDLTRQLDALAVVETAYRAPVGEDPGIAKPEAE
jgi:hypothetical protein